MDIFTKYFTEKEICLSQVSSWCEFLIQFVPGFTVHFEGGFSHEVLPISSVY